MYTCVLAEAASSVGAISDCATAVKPVPLRVMIFLSILAMFGEVKFVPLLLT